MDFPLYVIDNWFWWLLVVFTANLLAALVFYGPLVFHKPKAHQDSSSLPPLSVIVVGRNEIDNLQRLLPLILQQDYPDFELVVINDRSYDGSHDWLHQFANEEKQITFESLNEDELHIGPGKKFALSLAVKRAKHEHLVFIDADCKPASTQWLKSFGAAYAQDKQVVLGYSPYSSEPGLLNMFIRFEAFWVAWQYLSLALLGKPYMGVGRNLGYTKSRFLQNKGFGQHMTLPYGDDDLLIQQIATRQNTAILCKPASQVLSYPKKSWGEWFFQKRRHAAASVHYTLGTKLLLGLLWMLQILPHLALLAYLIYSSFSWLNLGMYLFVQLLWWIFALTLQLRFSFFSGWWGYPLWQGLYHMVLLPIFALWGWLSPPKKRWK